MKKPVGLVFVLAGLFVLWLASSHQMPVHAIYIDGNYSRTTQTPTVVQDLLVQYRHPDEFWLFGAKIGPDGTILDQNYTLFADAVHNVSPRTKVVVAFGYLTDIQPLTDSNRTTNLLKSIPAHAKAFGYDAVLLDFEPIMSGDTLYLEFLDNMSTALGTIPLGVYAFRLNDVGGKYQWTDAYFKEVASHVDFLQPALYNTKGQAPEPFTTESYQAWVHNQTARTDLMNLSATIYWGLPAYPATQTHIVSIENIGTAAQEMRGRSTAIFSGAYWTEGDTALYDALLRTQTQWTWPWTN